MSRVCVALLPLVIVACFRPSIGEVDCGPLRECPPGKFCDTDNVCRDPANRLPDASVVDSPSPDAAEPVNVAHVPADAADPGVDDRVITGELRIDTTTLEASGQLDFALRGSAQLDGGPAIAIWPVKSLTIEVGASVFVTGARPLIIIGEGDIVVRGLLDASANRDVPGPGGVADGAGGNGEVVGMFHGGPGGGGFGSEGAQGGNTEAATGGSGGLAFGSNDLSILTGGSRGAAGAGNTACERPGGAGGGAIQLSSFSAVRIEGTGVVNAGGGGGFGGRPCNGAGGPGGAGGAGGAIYLEAPLVQVLGTAWANGGGGGGGSGDDADEDGQPGDDSTPGQRARGGNAGNDGGRGGEGANDLVNEMPERGQDNDTDNGAAGGGGGGAGRITVEGSLMFMGVASPAPTELELR